MYGVVTADIVIPLITVTAIAIVFAIMAYLDKCEAEKRAGKLTNDFWQEHDFAERLVERVVELKERIAWLEQLTTEEESSAERQKRKLVEAPAGDERPPQSESSSWQVQSYYATPSPLEGKDQREASFGKREQGF